MTKFLRFSLGLAFLGWVVMGWMNAAFAQEHEDLSSERDEFSGKTVVSREMARSLMKARATRAPKVGELAPEFELPSAVGQGRVKLASLLSEKPVVLIMTSWSCDVFRSSSEGLIRLQKAYGDRWHFVLVYIREAHPQGGFMEELGNVVDARDLAERTNTAARCRASMNLPYTVLVDTLMDPVATRWGAWPSRLFVVEQDGRIGYSGAPGPWGYRPYRGFLHGTGEPLYWDEPFSKESLEAYLASKLKKIQ